MKWGLSLKVLFATLLFLSFGSGARSQDLEVNVDRMGGDYTSFNLGQSNPAQCRNACQQDTRCRAWTYVRPGVQGQYARCWLKSVIPAAVASNCCVSGVKSVSAGYLYIWEKMSGPGGPWNTGWQGATSLGCPLLRNCNCPDPNTARCAVYSHSQHVVWAAYGCSNPTRWIIRCSARSQ